MLTPRHPTSIPIERGFCRLAHGDVHYRAAGTGPVVLALHESPRSSLSLLPVIEALAQTHRVIALDTPGYGLSAPLSGAEPEMDDFLDAIAGFLDTLGLDRVAIYGAHTGAALATAFAQRWPARVTALALDGLSAFDEAEVASFRTDYLTPYEPRWDGSHVMALWSRVRDLYTWFPWHDQTSTSRLKADPTDVTALDRSALGFLQSGQHYAKAYTHAAAFQPQAAMRNLTLPATVFARPDDLIAHHLDRLVPGRAWRIRRLGPTQEEWTTALHDAVVAGGPANGQDGPAPRPLASGSHFVALGQGWLHVIIGGADDGPWRALIPDLPGDPAALLASDAERHPDHRLIVLSPPGCGWSDPLADADADLTASVCALDAVLAQLGITLASLAGQGAGTVLAQALARVRGDAVLAEAIDPPAWIADRSPLPQRPLLRSAASDWDGGHLTTAWFQVRDLHLYDTPPGSGPAVRRKAERLDVAALDRVFANYVQGPDCARLLAQVIEHLRTDGAPSGAKGPSPT